MRAADSMLHKEILLAAHDRLGSAGVRGWSRELGFVLAAAVLVELERSGRITVGPDMLYAKDATRATDPVSDALLERVLLAPRTHRVHRWLQREGDTVLDLTTAHLLQEGTLSERRRKRWGMFPVIDHLPSNPTRATQAYEAIRTAATHPAHSPGPAHTAAALLSAAGLSTPLGHPRTPWSTCPAPLLTIAGELALTLAVSRVPPALG